MIFDMDGTLGNTLPVVVQALQETFSRYGGREYSRPEIEAMFGPSEEGVIQTRVPADDYPAALQLYLDRYAELHDLATEPFPGVLHLLEVLQARGIRRAIVTGKGPGTARISMEHMGLDRLIERLMTGSPAGAEKPAAMRRCWLSGTCVLKKPPTWGICPMICRLPAKPACSRWALPGPRRPP